MTILWKTLEEHFPMRPLIFDSNILGGKCIFEFASKIELDWFEEPIDYTGMEAI
jgi:hypothetical protein